MFFTSHVRGAVVPGPTNKEELRVVKLRQEWLTKYDILKSSQVAIICRLSKWILLVRITTPTDTSGGSHKNNLVTP